MLLRGQISIKTPILVLLVLAGTLTLHRFQRVRPVRSTRVAGSSIPEAFSLTQGSVLNPSPSSNAPLPTEQIVSGENSWSSVTTAESGRLSEPSFQFAPSSFPGSTPIFSRFPSSFTAGTETHSEPVPANATLEFSRIYAVSGEDPQSPTAWRQHGLVAAANISGLEIIISRSDTIDDLPLSWYFRLPFVPKRHQTRLEIGSALSMKGHIDVLQRFVISGLPTALILEDDTDWDVRIREQLRPGGAISQRLRALAYVTKPTTSHKSGSTSPPVHESGYGSDWDVLHLGHCSYAPGKRQIHVEDPTAPNMHKTRTIGDKTFYSSFPPGQRAIVYGGSAGCTFAYGVTAVGAKKILDNITWDKHLDVGIEALCTTGLLRCNVVAPELFHHQRAVGLYGTRDSLDMGTSPAKAQKPTQFFTMNIMYSARCNAHSDASHVRKVPGTDMFECLPSDLELEAFGT